MNKGRPNEAPKSADRYPGLRPFVKEDNIIFFGRNTEIGKLLQSTKVNQTFILFGKSGLGKSSLVNAGVIPRLFEAGYHPIVVRFYNSPDTPLTTIAAQIRAQLSADIVKDIPAKFADNLGVLFSKWDAEKKPILIFDQFEEFFYHEGLERISALRELAAMVNRTSSPGQLAGTAPDPVQQDFLRNLPPVVVPQLFFIIRSDRLNMMNEVAERIPGLFNNRYELKPLLREKAEQAIVLPAQIRKNVKGDPFFRTLPFGYSLEAIKIILDTLSNNMGEVECSQLQIICQELEDIAKAKTQASAEQQITIDPSDFGGQPGLKKILNEFYRKQLRRLKTDKELDLDDMDIRTVRQIIEEQLISGNKRIVQSEGRVREIMASVRPGVEKIGNQDKRDVILDRLLSLRLIREEESHLGKVYEISHDTLLESMIQMRDQRLQDEQETALREAKRQLKVERRRNNITTLALIVVVLLAGFLIWGLIRLKREDETIKKQKGEVEQLYGQFILSSAEKVYHNDNNDALAFYLLRMADSLLDRKGQVADSTLRRWPLLEYSGKDFQSDKDGTELGCLYNDGILQLFRLADSIRAKNPTILIPHVADFALSPSGSDLAILDAFGRSISIYRLAVRNAAIDTVLQTRVPYTYHGSTNYMVLGENYLCSFIGKDSVAIYLENDTAAKKFHYYTIPFGSRLAANRKTLYLSKTTTRNVLKIDLGTGDSAIISDAVLFGKNETGNHRSYLYTAKDGLVSRIDRDNLTPLLRIDRSIDNLFSFFETDKYYVLYAYIPSRGQMKGGDFCFLPKAQPAAKGSIPVLTVRNSLLTSAPWYVSYSADQPMLLTQRGDTLLTLGSDGQWIRQPIAGAYTWSLATRLNSYLSKDGTKIFVSNYTVHNLGVIYLGSRPHFSFLGGPFFSFSAKLGNWDLFYSDGGIYDPAVRRKDTSYWKKFYEPPADLFTKRFGLSIPGQD